MVSLPSGWFTTLKGKCHNSSGMVSPICNGLISDCPSAVRDSADCAQAVDRLNNMKQINAKTDGIDLFFESLKIIISLKNSVIPSNKGLLCSSLSLHLPTTILLLLYR